MEVVSDERRTSLASASIETLWPILRNGSGSDAIPEFSKLGGDSVFTPGQVLDPHVANQGPQFCVDGLCAAIIRACPKAVRVHT
jgi:hypothetical protein